MNKNTQNFGNGQGESMKDLIKTTDDISMTTVEIAEQTGKRSDHVKRDAENMLLELYGETSFPKFGECYKADNGQKYTCYRLPKREVLILVSGYSISLRAKIIDRLEELEKAKNLLTPNFSNPAEAARAWALEYEQKQLAIAERNHAIKTKAEIGNRREATAMATASVKARENEKLKEQIGDSKKYKQVKAIPWLSEYFNTGASAVYSQIGRLLTKFSKAMEREPKEIEDSKWGRVKAYDVDVIDNFKGLVSEDPNILAKYRKA